MLIQSFAVEDMEVAHGNLRWESFKNSAIPWGWEKSLLLSSTPNLLFMVGSDLAT